MNDLLDQVKLNLYFETMILYPSKILFKIDMVAFFIIHTQKADEQSNKVLKSTICLFTPTRKVYAENAGADPEFPLGGGAHI